MGSTTLTQKTEATSFVVHMFICSSSFAYFFCIFYYFINWRVKNVRYILKFIKLDKTFYKRKINDFNFAFQSIQMSVAVYLKHFIIFKYVLHLIHLISVSHVIRNLVNKVEHFTWMWATIDGLIRFLLVYNK